MNTLPLPSLRVMRRSRSLASMLPAVLLSGVVTLVVTAVMHLMWSGLTAHFPGLWLESWLIAWPIAFPVTYLAAPLFVKLASSLSAPAARTTPDTPGIAFNDIAAASERATAAHRLTVRRNLKDANDFRA